MLLRTLFFACMLMLTSSIFSSAQSTLPPNWLYSSYFGGTRQDGISAQTRDADGNIYVAGTSNSPNFPTTPGTYEPTYPGPWGYNAIFVAKFSPVGSLIWSTFVGPGCPYYLSPSSIQVDSSQNVYIAGIDECYTFPATSSPLNYGTVFVGKLNSSGSQLLYGADLGGWAVLGSTSVVVDSAGEAFVTGAGGNCCNSNTGIIGPLGGIDDFWTSSADLSGGAWFSGYTEEGLFTTLNAYQPQNAGGNDGFLLHTNFAGLCETSTVAVCNIAPSPYSSERIEFTAQATNVEGATSIKLMIDGLSAFTSHAAQFDAWLPVAPGNHTATVVLQSANESPQKAQQTFYVASSSACPLSPVIPSLTICSPLNAASVSGSVSIVVEANDGSAPPANIALYVDGKYTATLPNQNGSYTHTLTLSSGSHTLTVNGKDSNSDHLQASTVFKVQ